MGVTTHNGMPPMSSQRKPVGQAALPSFGSHSDAQAPVSAPTFVTHSPSAQSSLKRQRAPKLSGGLQAPQPAA